MKKITLSILGLLLCATGFAKDVSPSEASKAAMRLMAEKNVSVSSVESVTPVYFHGEKTYYVVNFAPQGWVLVNSDDVVAPIMGYSENGSFSATEMPDNMRGWLGLNAEQVIEYRNVVKTRNADWDKSEIKLKSAKPKAASDKVSPIIKVNWDQGNPYNKYCPSNASGRAVVGCVAVAMAQAMSVPQYPERPVNSISFNSGNSYGNISIDFTKEPAYNWANILSGANSKDDVARLLWHCGMATEMNYGPGGSGTYTTKVPAALKKYFDYPKSVTYISRDNYSDKDWNAIILDELKAGRPIIYHGYPDDGTAGHCFNLDGYDGAFYHVNWGWGGVGNGNFSLDKLAAQVVPGGPTMSFTMGHGMVTGVRAPSSAPTSISLSNTVVAEKQPAGTVVGAVSVECDYDNVTYTFKVQGPKGLFGYTEAPFEVKDGNLVTTKPINAMDYEDIVTGTSMCNITITATNTKNESVSRQFNISIKAASAITDVTIDENAPVEYYNLQGVKVENPTQGLYIKKQGTKTSKVIL
ncbi:MAG: hypothetical protein E7080_01585 [Bacteroidales bacterium]|nr:hypothetical protein [Bacteroidales bacterium]